MTRRNRQIRTIRRAASGAAALGVTGFAMGWAWGGRRH